MAQRLPDPDEIRKLLEGGQSQQQIAEQFGVSRQAVSWHVRARNLQPAPRRYAAVYIPWHMPRRFSNTHKCAMLRLYARRDMGETLTERETRMLDAWTAEMDRLGAVLDYTDDRGLYLVPRRPQDKGYVRDPSV